MLLVYTHKITPRVTYIFKHIFIRILNSPVKFTSNISDFVAHNGPKLSYTKAQLGTEFFVRSHELLFEQGINDFDLNIYDWDGIPCFFKVGDTSVIPYDIFAASFFLISRYEEYLPHVKDQFDRFPAEESLAYKNGFLDKPIIEIWAYKLLAVLKDKFENFEYKKNRFNFISTFDVDSAFAFKNKGLVRSFGGFVKDIFRFRLQRIFLRILVIFKFRKDPFNDFNYIINLHKRYKIETIFFFLIGDYTSYDKNISYLNTNFRSLIKSIADYCKVGLHPSFYTMKDELKLKKEKRRLEEIINTPVVKSRQHFLRTTIPETYQDLIDLEINEDYSMGYAQYFGFRAGTCTPFYFYNINYEIQTPLKVFPFAVMDGTLKDYLFMSTKTALTTILRLADEVKKVDGTFITLFHNETLSETERWIGWRKLYKDMVEQITEKM